MAKENGTGTETKKTPDPKSLWGAFMKAYKAQTAAETALAAARDAQSTAAADILKAMGSGPFNVPGLGVVSIVMRQPKDEDGQAVGEPTYFIKRLGNTEIQNIEL